MLTDVREGRTVEAELFQPALFLHELESGRDTPTIDIPQSAEEEQLCV